MNRHFNDAKYNVRQAYRHLTAGVKFEADTITQRVNAKLGRETVPRSRREEVRARVGRLTHVIRRYVERARARVPIA